MTRVPPIGWGMTSMVLGTTGLLLSILPVLGLPLSALGIFFGLLGIVVALRGGAARLRWAVLGVGLCSMALGINIALAFAPSGYPPGHAVPKSWQAVPDRPWVPPPARPGFWNSPRSSETRPAGAK